jgi:restriction system protein
MAIPDYQSIMLPLMQYASDEKIHSFVDACHYLKAHFGLSEAEYREMLPSGRELLFRNRVGWAKSYLTKAGLLAPSKGPFRITERGLEALHSGKKINSAFLRQYPEFLTFQRRTHRYGANLCTQYSRRNIMEEQAIQTLEENEAVIEGDNEGDLDLGGEETFDESGEERPQSLRILPMVSAGPPYY